LRGYPFADVTVPLGEWLHLPPTVAQSTFLIDGFRLSPKLVNALKRNAVNTLEQLSALTPRDLLAMRNVGPGYVKEIVDTLTDLTSAAACLSDARWPPLDGCLTMMHGEPAQAPAGPSGLGRITDQEQPDPVTVPIALSAWLTLPPSVAQSTLPLKRLHLSALVANALEFNRVETVAQLSSLSPSALFGMPRIGRESIKEIMAMLTRLSAQTPESLDPDAIIFGDLYREDMAVASLLTSEAGPDDVNVGQSARIAAVRHMLSDTRFADNLLARGVLVDMLPLPRLSGTWATGSGSQERVTTLGDVAVRVTRLLANMLPHSEITAADKAIVELRGTCQAFLQDMLAATTALYHDRDTNDLPSGLRLCDLLALLLLNAPERAIDVVSLHYGLRDGQTHTLQNIAVAKGLSRGRIHQVESRGLDFTWRKRAISLAVAGQLLRALVEPFMAQRSGVATVDELVEDVTQRGLAGPVSAPHALRFLLDRTKVLAPLGGDVYALPQSGISSTLLDTVRQAVIARLESAVTSIEFAALIGDAGVRRALNDYSGAGADRLITVAIRSDDRVVCEGSRLDLRRREWRWTDELIRALRELKQPAHFTRIAEATNALLPSDRQVHVRNVHAMMHRRDDLFVRTGMGVYGLAEWGIAKEWTIADTVYRILSESGQPLPMRELTARVLEYRQARPTSVGVMVGADKRFCRVGPKIGLCEWRK